MSKIEVDTIEPQSGTTVTLGALGDTITVPSGATINLANATTAGIGKIGQVVQSSVSATVSLTSTSLTDTGLSATITPSATTSNILISTFAQFGVPTTGSSGDDTFIHLLRGATSIGGAGNIDSNTFAMVNATGGEYESRYLNILYLDSPSTTSATTYKLQFKNRNAAKQAYFNRRGGDTLSSGQSYMILMEVLA